MATVRKLQAEIDKTFRKVDEQQEVFQQVFDRLHECDQSLKEKYEVLLICDKRAFFPLLNWNAQLFCHARSISLSLSRPTLLRRFFLCRDDEAWWSSSLGAFSLRLSFFCAVACSRTCFAGKHKRAVVHHNFRPNGKRGISL